mmetsp:Transcript_8969/g.8323  ORF Transcript_8969/g.8323 Transcript_8969/m.8323 type:complete len:111 (+) Transcript_8969:499-831(+)
MRDGVTREGCNPANYQTLDVNLTSHSFKNHIDYVVLLRKMVLYFETKAGDKSSTNENMLLSGRNQEDLSKDYISLKLDIESGIRLKNPVNDLEAPNSFVYLKLPFRNCNP